MANAATVTATMATAAKNSFAVAMAQGGAGPQDCLLHLTDFVSWANGFLNCPLEGLIRMETVPPDPFPDCPGDSRRGQRPRPWIDATCMKVRQNNRIVSVAAIIDVGVNSDGRREVLGLDIAASEAEPFWAELSHTN